MFKRFYFNFSFFCSLEFVIYFVAFELRSRMAITAYTKQKSEAYLLACKTSGKWSKKIKVFTLLRFWYSLYYFFFLNQSIYWSLFYIFTALHYALRYCYYTPFLCIQVLVVCSRSTRFFLVATFNLVHTWFSCIQRNEEKKPIWVYEWAHRYFHERFCFYSSSSFLYILRLNFADATINWIVVRNS